MHADEPIHKQLILLEMMLKFNAAGQTAQNKFHKIEYYFPDVFCVGIIAPSCFQVRVSYILNLDSNALKFA